MKLLSLHVRRMPGIRDPFTLAGLGGAINIVIGPNGSGKSTICRSVTALLWPDSADVEVMGHWQLGSTGLRAVREGRNVRWESGGKEVSPPDSRNERLR